jgi:hypothetical protein
MKQITIKCFSNGTTTTNADFLYFDRENDTTQVTIEFPSEYALWHKRADILVGFDKSTDFKIGTDESLSFLLGAEHLKKGYLTIQPIVYQDTSVVKFEHCKYSVRTSLNVLENDTSVTTSVALVLQGEIEDLQDTKVDKVIGKGLSTNDYTDLEKSKLEGIEEGAEVNTVTSVATRTGDVVLTKSDVGLSNVDNTSDVDKPISTLTQTALDNKVDEPTVEGTNGQVLTTDGLGGRSWSTISGNSDQFIFSYVFNGNAEYYPTALDIATGTFTLNNHGLANNTRIFGTINLNQIGVDLATILPTNLVYTTEYFVVNATQNTFQISTTSGGSALTFTTTGDLTRWHFEVGNTNTITFTGLAPYKRLTVYILGFAFNGVWQSVFGALINNTAWTRGRQSLSSQQQQGFGSAGSYYHETKADIVLFNGFEMVDTYSQSFSFNSDTRTTAQWKTSRAIGVETYTTLNVSVPTRNFKNGTRIEVYK